MNAAELLDHFDRISDAPDAIPRLRRFILDLAVMGKLVEQDPNDEPASKLLTRIRAEKARLVKEGKIGSQKLQAEAVPTETELLLPKGWVWARLGDVILLVSGQHLQPNEYSGQRQSGPPYITGPADFGQNGLVITRYAVVRKAVARKGQILLTVKGAGVGKTAICDLPEVAISRQLMAMTAIEWSQEFLLLTTHRLAEALKESARSLIPGISREDVDQFVFPLPPLAEQHRIVAKVDELMVLCDRLEASQAERERCRDRLAAASLHRLNNGTDVDDYRKYVRFHLDHLPRLATRPEHVQQLRQTILNLAVRGKLVPQDPSDEPASELLKTIEVEKLRAVRTDETKKLENCEPVEANEVPFDIPSGWEVTRMGSLARKLGAGSTPLGGKSVYQREGIPFLRSQNVYNDGLRLDDVALISRAIHERMSGTHIQQQDILLNITGASIGRCALVPSTFAEGNVSQHVAIVRLFLPVIREFIHLSLTSPFFQKVIDDVQVGVSREGLSMKTLRLFPMLLPPLAEQHRIVAKVDELMVVCDRLEAQLTTTQTESRRLLETVLHEALSEVNWF